jgi:uncharacterized protein (DUF2147 family)
MVDSCQRVAVGLRAGVTLRAMRTGSHLILLALAFVLTGTPVSAQATAQDPGKVMGVWASKGTIFSISRDGDELLGEVIAMRKPRADRKNPDSRLRTRPVIGLQVLSDYQFKRGAWRGKLYDPGSGSTFSSYLKLDRDGNLRLRGYIGFSLFGKTEVFQPVSACSERIVGMLRLAEIEGHC